VALGLSHYKLENQQVHLFPIPLGKPKNVIKNMRTTRTKVKMEGINLTFK
jgi:hypothetical protein